MKNESTSHYMQTMHCNDIGVITGGVSIIQMHNFKSMWVPIINFYCLIFSHKYIFLPANQCCNKSIEFDFGEKKSKMLDLHMHYHIWCFLSMRWACSQQIQQHHPACQMNYDLWWSQMQILRPESEGWDNQIWNNNNLWMTNYWMIKLPKSKKICCFI